MAGGLSSCKIHSASPLLSVALPCPWLSVRGLNQMRVAYLGSVQAKRSRGARSPLPQHSSCCGLGWNFGRMKAPLPSPCRKHCTGGTHSVCRWCLNLLSTRSFSSV
jgi:hypothetical protein